MADDDVAWLRADHPRTVALGFVTTWAAAVEVQSGRALAVRGGVLVFAEASLLLFSLRQLVRAAEFARSACLTGAAQELATRALTEFGATVPGLKNARDMIEHFDDYERGAGRLTMLAADGQDSFAKRLLPDGSHCIKIGAEVIAIDAAAAAAARLSDQVYLALRADSKNAPRDVAWRDRL